MKFVRDYYNPKTGRVERVELQPNKQGFYVLHDLRLPSKMRKLRKHQVRLKSDVDVAAHLRTGNYGGRCIRVGVKGSIPSEFVGLEVLS